MASSMALAVALLSAGSAQAQNTAPFQIVETTIDDIHMAFRSGRLTARQLVQGYLDRINAHDKQGPTINSIITLNPNALAEADRLDAAFRKSGLVGPLHGITILVKDEIDTAGMPTTLGTVVFKDYRPPKDAFVIDKLRKAGAIILARRRSPNSPPATPMDRSSASRATPMTRAHRRRIVRRLGRSAGGEFLDRHDWRGNARIDPAAGDLERGGQPAADAGTRKPHRHVGRLPDRARPDGADGAHRARSRKLLDGMVGYDPEDPVTALGVGKVEGSYTRYLDQGALNGARIGILRESIGNQSDPNAADFKIVDAAFEKNVAELKALAPHWSIRS